MRKFLQQHKGQILGVLSGFDRMRLRGSLRLLQSEGGVAAWLGRVGVAVKSFLSFAEGLTKRFHAQANRLAEEAGRKVHYLPGVVDKEALVQEIREKQGVANNGLVAVLSTLEMGMSYTMFRRRSDDFAVLRRMPRKCKHYYFYWDDGRFGLTQVRLSSWFPFDAHVVLNGREWLAQQMDAKGMSYVRQDNCFVKISDFARAQKLADQQVRIRHCAGKNRLKMYNKCSTLLRVETTLNDGKGLKVYRRKQDDPDGKRQWLDLRKTVADVPRRVELSQAANERYLEAISTISAETPLSSVTDKLCRAVYVNGRRHRGLRPFDPEEVRLLEAVSRGEFLIRGFRNRDVRVALYGQTEEVTERRCQSGRVSRKLALLRAHGLIKKIPRTHRYLLTSSGVQAISAILAARRASLAQLTAA